MKKVESLGSVLSKTIPVNCNSASGICFAQQALHMSLFKYSPTLA